jgi:hypothetical protein
MSLQFRSILLLSILALLSFQSKAQEIETREDALLFIRRSNERINLALRGMEGGGTYIIDGTKMVNENLIFLIRKRKYEKIDGTYGYTYGSIQNFILDFSDSLKLTEEKTWMDYLIPLSISYENYYFSNRDQLGNSKGKERKLREEKGRKLLEEYYKALKKLEQTRKINETEEYKLSELKKGKLNNTKTEISEEQRKYIVQANAANENKDYENALTLFQNALNINPYSYPAAYFNMALIHANLYNYYQSVYAMKKYLILAPDAEDARQAQDKIYEWELNIKGL